MDLGAATGEACRRRRRSPALRYATHTAADLPRPVEPVNATFATRQQTIWGTGSTAVASDSTHFSEFDQNIFTEYHSRYGGRGVLIYWHVERKSMAIHSQTHQQGPPVPARGR